MCRAEQKVLLKAFKEFVKQSGLFSVDTEQSLFNYGYDPEFVGILFDSGWTAARMIRMGKYVDSKAQR